MEILREITRDSLGNTPVRLGGITVIGEKTGRSGGSDGVFSCRTLLDRNLRRIPPDYSSMVRGPVRGT